MDEAIPRRLYEQGFEDWDLSQASYATDYLIMVVGVICAGLAWDKIRSDVWLTLWGLVSQCAVFSLLEGVGYGFGGIAHHLLDTYYEQGHVMGRRWGAPQSDWMFAWLMAVMLVPLASASCLGTALAFGRFAEGWIKVAKGLGFLVSVFEGYLCLNNQLDTSGSASVYWGIATSLLACLVVFAGGAEAAGLWQLLFGNISRLVGFGILVSAPASCKVASIGRSDCPYPEDFNHNACYHVCIAVSVAFIYWGVATKYNRDCDHANFEIIRMSQKSASRLCGC